MLVPASLALLALTGTASASLFQRGTNRSDFINGVHVNDAVQAQLAKDFELLGWNASSIAGSEPLAAVEKGHNKHVARATAKTKKRFAYGGATKVRGVNVGSWLVTEPFMSPSLYLAATKAHPKVVDEYTLCAQNGRAWCTSTLMAHYQTFITEQDFIDIAAAGLNHVRIPFGFWGLDISGGEPYVQGSLAFLQQGVLWAQKHGLSVVMDIHGLPGSQNGQDNSGRRGPVSFYGTPNNIVRSEAVLKALVAEFTKPVYGNTVTMYEPVNEPRDISTSALATLKQYYLASWGIINGGSSGVAYTFLSDAFMGLGQWLNFLPTSQYPLTAYDKHVYSVFTPAGYKLNTAQRIANYCNRKSELQLASKKHVVIVGEWSYAPNDCGQQLAGLKYGKGLDTIGMASRYAGAAAGYKKIGSCTGLTGSGAKFSASYKATLRKMWEVQVATYEAYSAGWLMWAWKTENVDEWSYQAGLKYGWIPQNPTQLKYGNQCAAKK